MNLIFQDLGLFKKKKKKLVENDLMSKKFLKGQIKSVCEIIGDDGNNNISELKKEMKKFYERGVKYRSKLKKEIKRLEKQIKKNPKSFEPRRKLIEYIMHINPEKALLHAQELPKICENDQLDLAYAELARTLINNRLHAEGMEYAKKALEINPNNALAMNGKAAALQEPECFSEGSLSQRTREIIELCDKSIELEPDNIYFLFTKIWSLKERSDFQEAMDILDKKVYPLMNWYTTKLYYCYSSSVQYEFYRNECILNALRSVLLEPRTLTGISMLSSGYDLFSRYEDSLELAEKFTESYKERIGPLDETQLLFLARNYLNCGYFEKAIRLCRTALKKRFSARSHAFIAICFYHSGDRSKFDEAIGHCEKAIEKAEEIRDGYVFRTYADLLFEKKRIKEAMFNYIEAERFNSSYYLCDQKLMLEHPDCEFSRKWEDRFIVMENYIRSVMEHDARNVVNQKQHQEEEFEGEEQEEEYNFWKDRENCHRYFKVKQWICRMRGDYEECKKFYFLMEERDLYVERWKFMMENCSTQKLVISKNCTYSTTDFNIPYFCFSNIRS